MEIRRLPGWSPELSHSDLDELYHHGIKGQRWGIRRYQNPDGSLTAAGEAHYNRVQKREEKRQAKIEKRHDKAMSSNSKKVVNKYSKYLSDDELSNKVNRFKNEDYLRQKPVKQYSEGQKFAMRMAEKVLTGAMVAGAAYVGSKYVSKKIKNHPLYDTTISAIKATAEKGEKAVNASKKVAETVNKTAENVSKMAGNAAEVKARLAAQKAFKNGASKEAARKIYKTVLNRG